MTIESGTLLEALARNEIHVAPGSAEPGTEIAVAGESTPDGKLLAVYGGDRPRSRLPIRAEDARVLADGVLAYHHHVAPRVRKMLEQLFARVGAFFEAPELVDVRLLVRIGTDGYTVVQASADATREFERR